MLLGMVYAFYGRLNMPCPVRLAQNCLLKKLKSRQRKKFCPTSTFIVPLGSVTKFKIMSDGYFDNSKQDKNYLKYILE